MSKLKTDDVVETSLKAELAELQPAIAALDSLPDLEAAVRVAVQAYAEWMDSEKRPKYAADENAIALNHAKNEAIAARDKVRGEGDEAKRRARRITALLTAGDEIEKLKKLAADDRNARRAATERAERTAALADEIRDEVDMLETERATVIDRGVDERLAGRTDTSAEAIARIDAKLVIQRAALTGAERAHANSKAELERVPHELTNLDGKLRVLIALRGELEWKRAFRADAIQGSAARYLAAKAINFAGQDRFEFQPPRDLVDAAVAELNSEIGRAHV